MAYLTAEKRTLTIGGCTTVQLTSCLTVLDLAKQVKLLLIQHEQNKQNKHEVSYTVILPLQLVFSVLSNLFRSKKVMINKSWYWECLRINGQPSFKLL